jgi:hypothetical protein
MENYRVWAQDPQQPQKASSTLFDTVAVYLAFSDAFLKMEQLGIRVTDDGFTRVDPLAKQMQVATAWKDKRAFDELLADRLTNASK